MWIVMGTWKSGNLILNKLTLSDRNIVSRLGQRILPWWGGFPSRHPSIDSCCIPGIRTLTLRDFS